MKVSLKKLTKKFKSIVAVNELSLEVQKNKTIGILGPNGCGKTTTIGMILGLINPTSGLVEIDDQDINKINRSEILKKINFASPYIELPKKLTVMENLVVYSKLYDIPKKEQRIEELVTDLNLTKIVFKKNGELSSGQKNRVALAKSLINKPKLLLLDEPTASLDPDVGDYVRTYIETYKKNNEITLILASHNMIEVERLCEEVIMMREGNIVDRGSCQGLIKKHGRKNQIEGKVLQNQKVVVIEDLISTGMSSLNAVKALIDSKLNVLGMIAIFTYGFDISKRNFTNDMINLDTLCDYSILLKKAVEAEYISEKNLETLSAWNKDPENWS